MKKKNKFLGFFAPISSFFRILIPLFIFQNPLFVSAASIFLDWIDAGLYRQTSLTRRQYQSIDKALDLFWYTLSLIYASKNLNFFNLLLFLYLFRLVGHILFYKTRNEKFFIFFPNFYENLFLLLIFIKSFPQFSYLTSSENLYGVLFALFAVKLIHELIAHKFDKLYYPFIPDWGKAPE